MLSGRQASEKREIKRPKQGISGTRSAESWMHWIWQSRAGSRWLPAGSAEHSRPRSDQWQAGIGQHWCGLLLSFAYVRLFPKCGKLMEFKYWEEKSNGEWNFYFHLVHFGSVAMAS